MDGWMDDWHWKGGEGAVGMEEMESRVNWKGCGGEEWEGDVWMGGDGEVGLAVMGKR
jgi:hypothetical protein